MKHNLYTQTIKIQDRFDGQDISRLLPGEELGQPANYTRFNFHSLRRAVEKKVEGLL